jgi:hypothetical protein
MAQRAPTDARKRSRTAAVNGAGATVARIVVCSCRSTCGLREPPLGSVPDQVGQPVDQLLKRLFVTVGHVSIMIRVDNARQ